MNARTVIRNKIKDVIRNKTIAADNIHTNRHVKVEDPEAPIILIYANEEPTEKFQESPFKYQRTLKVTIEMALIGAQADDDLMDAELEKIEDEIHRADNPDAPWAAVQLKNSSFGGTAEGGRPIIIGKLDFEFEYQTDPFERILPTNDFLELTSEFDINQDKTVDFKNTFEISQS